MLLIRFIISGIVLITAQIGHCQVDSLIITGHISGVDKGYVQIWVPKFDSTFYLTHNKVPIKQGEFVIRGYLKFPRLTALVVFNDENVLFETEWFFIDPGYQHLKIDKKDSLINFNSSSKSFHEYAQNFKPTIDSLNKILSPVNEYLNKDPNALYQSVLDSLSRLKRILEIKKEIFLLEYIMENPGSYISLAELSATINSNQYSSLYEIAFSFLDEALKLSSEGQEILKKIGVVKKLGEGMKFPSFELLDINRQPTSLYQRKLGKFTLIDFWFHNCGYCLAQFPELKKTYEAFHGKAFDIVGITVDKEKYEIGWKKVVDKYELPWHQYWDINGIHASKFLINKFPTNFLLNEKGEIIAKNISIQALNDFLSKNL